MPACKVPESFIVAWRENDAEKEAVFSQETGILKGQISILIFYYP